MTQQQKERMEELKQIICNPETNLQQKKQAQKELIEMIANPEPWVKQEIITIVDEQISEIPELDRERYIYSIKSFEHPEGQKLALDAHPTLRIRENKIVRDRSGNPEGFFWDKDVYDKMKKKSKTYLIGTETGRYLENYVQLRNRLTSNEDGFQLSFKVARNKKPLEVFESPAEERIGVLVTPELAEALNHKLRASYSDDPEELAPVEIGDLLVQDISDKLAGLYYRVAMKEVNETYRQGTL